jgi:hypothetical protein
VRSSAIDLAENKPWLTVNLSFLASLSLPRFLILLQDAAALAACQAAMSECVIPPVPKRSGRMPGRQPKPDNELIFVTYDCAATIGATFRSLCRHEEAVVLIVFDEDRLEFASMTRDDTMMVRVHMPRSAFIAFRGVAERRVFAAPAVSLQQWAAMCEAPAIGGESYSLTLMYEQSGLRNEVLHMMLYPRDGDVANATVTRSSISPLCDEDGSVADVRLVAGRTDCYQYEVVLRAHTFAIALASLIDASECPAVTLLLGDRAFEMSVVSRDGRSRTTVTCGVEPPAQTGGADDGRAEELARGDDRRKRAASSGDIARTASGTTGARSRITSLSCTRAPLRLFRNYCMPAGQLRDLAHMIEVHLARGNGGETITLRLGVGPDETPLPLFADYQVRCDAPMSSYALRCWIAPCATR